MTTATHTPTAGSTTLPANRPTTTPLKVCGIDPSLTATGIASTAGWCELTGKTGITTLPLTDRYKAIARLAEDIHGYTHGADLVAIEKLTFNRETGGRGGAGERAGLYWLVVRHLVHAGIPVVEVPTATVKVYATGRGGAKKHEVIDAVARRWPTFETRGDDNLCDAVVLCALGADWAGQPLAKVPASHRKALSAVAWPELVTA